MHFQSTSALLSIPRQSPRTYLQQSSGSTSIKKDDAPRAKEFFFGDPGEGSPLRSGRVGTPGEGVPLFSARCAQIRVINIERKFGRQNCVVCPPETPPPKLSPGIEPADATRQLPGVGMKQRSWFLFTPQPNTPIGVGATTLSVWCVCLSGVGGLAGLWVDVCMVV